MSEGERISYLDHLATIADNRREREKKRRIVSIGHRSDKEVQSLPSANSILRSCVQTFLKAKPAATKSKLPIALTRFIDRSADSRSSAYHSSSRDNRRPVICHRTERSRGNATKRETEKDSHRPVKSGARSISRKSEASSFNPLLPLFPSQWKTQRI